MAPLLDVSLDAVPTADNVSALPGRPVMDDDLGIPRITLRQLVYFAAAARHGSALRAAEELSISPPAISSAIAGLESLLDEQLFIRHHARGLTLTDAGQQLLQNARGIIGQVRQIESNRLLRNRHAYRQVAAAAR